MEKRDCLSNFITWLLSSLSSVMNSSFSNCRYFHPTVSSHSPIPGFIPASRNIHELYKNFTARNECHKFSSLLVFMYIKKIVKREKGRGFTGDIIQIPKAVDFFFPSLTLLHMYIYLFIEFFFLLLPFSICLSLSVSHLKRWKSDEKLRIVWGWNKSRKAWKLLWKLYTHQNFEVLLHFFSWKKKEIYARMKGSMKKIAW